MGNSNKKFRQWEQMNYKNQNYAMNKAETTDRILDQMKS